MNLEPMQQKSAAPQGVRLNRYLKFVSLFIAALVLAACNSGLEAPQPELTTAAASTTTSAQVTTTLDDLEEASSGAVLYGKPANLVLEFSKDAQVIGLRFDKLQVPRGATISSAYLELTAAETDSGSTTLTFKAQAADSAPAFVTSRKNVSGRATTAASVSWSAPSWTKGQKVRSGDLGKVVQEVVSRSGWASGNALALIVSGDNKSARRAVSRNGGGTLSLTVTYAVAGADDEDEDTGNEGEPTEPSGSVSSSQKIWHSRLRLSIDTSRYAQTNSKNELDPLHIARTGNSYYIGRFGNMLETAYVLAYRETGDRKLMDFVNKFMITAQSGVKDHNGDGFRDIPYVHTNAGKYNNKDTSPMEEMLTHGTLASLTLALRDAGYSSTASWWTDYLKNDYAPKWESRGGIRHLLTHPRSNYIRYYYAMYKLTGDGSYLSKAKSEADLLKKTIRNDGWAHWFGRTSGCAPMVYVPLTSIALADLATNGSGLIDAATMRRAANVVATKAMKNSSGSSLAGDSCGNGSYSSSAAIATFSYSQMAAWDSSGRIGSISERVYNATERYNLSTPLRTPLPAALTFVKGR